MEFTPTAEQQAVIDAAQTGANLVIQAGAGTGKTSTLQMVAEARPRVSLYVAYNKSIATDAATKFPSLVKCKTSHSLAFGAVGRKFSHRLNSARRPSWELAKDMGLGWLKLGRDIRVAPHQQARIAGDTVRRFCYSADDELGAAHVPFQNGIAGRNHNDLVARILPLARDWWNDVNSIDGTMPFEHDHYLKMWALEDPDLFVDIVFLDEAQDSNPVLAKLIAAQEAQQIVVGDSCQQMYAWRGAVDALSGWKDSKELFLKQSWRFGEAIADEANKWLAQLPTPLELIGNPHLDSTLDELEDPAAILCRTNAGAMGAVLGSMEANKNVSLVGGGEQLARLAKACADLRAGKKTSHPELFAFDSWDEVARYAKEEASGSDLRPLVNLIDEHGTDKIIEATQKLVSEANADVVVSTVHKAKGREWDTVAVAGDFFEPRSVEGADPVIGESEAMVGYVAVTRAKMVLDRSNLAWIDDFVDPPEVDPVAEDDYDEGIDPQVLDEIYALPSAEKED
jgi:hypothetical protein